MTIDAIDGVGGTAERGGCGGCGAGSLLLGTQYSSPFGAGGSWDQMLQNLGRLLLGCIEADFATIS